MLPILSTKYSHYCFWGSCVTDKSGGWGGTLFCQGRTRKGWVRWGEWSQESRRPLYTSHNTLDFIVWSMKFIQYLYLILTHWLYSHNSQRSLLHTTITLYTFDPLTIWVTRHYTCPRCPKTLHHNYTETDQHTHQQRANRTPWYHKALHSFVKVVSSFMALNIDYDGSEHWLCQI